MLSVGTVVPVDLDAFLGRYKSKDIIAIDRIATIGEGILISFYWFAVENDNRRIGLFPGSFGEWLIGWFGFFLGGVFHYFPILHIDFFEYGLDGDIILGDTVLQMDAAVITGSFGHLIDVAFKIQFQVSEFPHHSLLAEFTDSFLFLLARRFDL